MNVATQREPLLTIGTIGSLVSAAIVLAQSFGVPLTDAQANALNAFVAIAAPIIIALIGRGLVFSPAGAQKLADDQYEAGLPPTDPQPPIPAPPGPA